MTAPSPVQTTHPSRAAQAARVVTEVTSPTLLAPALLLVISVRTELTDHRGALWWGLLAAVFVGAIPLAFLQVGVRRGRWDDRHVNRREARLLPLTVAACSVTAGIALLLGGHAPSPITALVVAMLVGLVSVLAVSRWWKVSIHSAVAGGTAVILAAAFGAVGLIIGVVLAAGAGWSRVRCRDHSVGQVVVGMGVGAAAALLYLPLR